MKHLKRLWIYPTLALLGLLSGCNETELTFTDMVNPFVGTGGHGHTYPGAALPFGMIQLSPDTRLEGWDGCSGYHFSDDTIYGFSHTALSGTGVSDYGDLLIMPVTGKPCLENGTGADHICSYASSFSKNTESASPGTYTVFLKTPKVQADLAASLRSGMHRYTWTGGGEAGLVIDLEHRDKVLGSGLMIVNDSTITGFRISEEWAREQHFYFALRFSKPFKSYLLNDSGTLSDKIPMATLPDSSGIKAWLGFDLDDDELLIRVGISAVDQTGALRNLDSEITHWDFDKVVADADSIWNSELGKIEVKGGSKQDRQVFYTALYHTMLAPNLWSDVDGRYRGMDMNIHHDEGSPQYTVFSLWDTYRTLHPLLTIIDQKRTNEFIRSFLRHYQQGGRLPVWELAANETDCMIGYHSVSVIADAYRKGIRDYDTSLALEAMVHSANLDHFGLEAYRKYGYIPADKESESVSKTLEYSYDDWCIAMMAREMGNDSLYTEFIRRAQYYKNLYDPSTGFFRPKQNSSFITPFDPREVNFHLTEANTWQYTFYVPHDLAGYMNLLGGEQHFTEMLDELFSTSSEMTGRVQSDITGLIGQYAHGNEPSHHMAYLYAYLGQQHKTAEMTRKIMQEMYTDKPDGLCGNEDCGQMSAWYVMSAMGFYPVCPGSNEYVIGSPQFSEILIHLENGKQFLVRARGNRSGSRYISRAVMNDKPFTRAYITHDEVMQGGDIRFLMGSRAESVLGIEATDRPTSAITDHLITPVPFFSMGEEVFFDEQEVRIAHADPNAVISWLSDPPMAAGDPLQGAIINQSKLFTAAASVADHTPSHQISAYFYKIPENRSIRLNTAYAPQYPAGGDHALIDFLRGGNDFRTGRWQGYHQVNLDAIVELEEEKMIRKISVGFLQDQRAWIFMPLEVTFLISNDGVNYQQVGSEQNIIPDRHNGTVTHDFSTPPVRQNARFVRVTAKNRGVCPPWHPGAGDKAWIFADEIVIE
ncbi:MAG: GH92 family glycosyl hydrolase [Bacteroidales bacterium]